MTFAIKEFSEILKMKKRRPSFPPTGNFWRQCYVDYFCKNYARIEKFVGGRYQLVLEIAYTNLKRYEFRAFVCGH
jgi:hypothetical protein